MEVILGKKAGFCQGVRNTVIKTKNNLEKKKRIYCLGQLVHNPEVIKKLEQKGLTIVQNIQDVPDGKELIIRAHGIPKKIYEEIEAKNIKLIDLTCPKVLNIHKKIEEYRDLGYYIIYIGEKTHPETVGSVSFAGDNSTIVYDLEDINVAVEDIIRKDIRNVTIFSQTTFSMEKFDDLVKIIKMKIPKDSNLEINKTICDATKLRQIETKEIAKQVELMIIIGGKKSSNTNKLYDIALKECSNVMFVETLEDLYINYIRRFKKVGVMAGASTPSDMIEKIVDILKDTETEGYMYENSR